MVHLPFRAISMFRRISRDPNPSRLARPGAEHGDHDGQHGEDGQMVVMP